MLTRSGSGPVLLLSQRGVSVSAVALLLACVWRAHLTRFHAVREHEGHATAASAASVENSGRGWITSSPD